MKMKKFAALAAATVMSVSAIAATSAFGVFATTDAGVNNIVIKDSDTNRVYKAYQIFDQASATNTIKWGKGINGDALLTKLKTSGLDTYMSQFDSAESAADVAKIISDADHWTKEDTAKFAKAAAGCIKTDNAVTATEANGEYTIVNNTWGDVGDNAIGDDVEFKITTTIPKDVSAYDKYTYTVRDQLSDGLTFNNNLTYKYYDASGNEITPVTVGPNTTVGVDDPSTADFKETFYVTFDIKELLKKYPNVDKIETLYSAKLNENANVVTGTLPNSKDNNTNTAYLTYSNNPQDTTGKEKGETPKVTVYDWTFSLVGNKVDEKGAPLAGAKFQLRNVHNDAIRLVKIADNVYRLEIGDEAGSVDYIETDATGKFTIKGIDDQTTYKLVEIEAPAQYNRADPYEFKFDTTYDPANTLQSIRMLDGTDSGTSGSTVKIINQKGGSLPTTGGIGTQIFYGVGGAIVLGAGVLLIAKKRAKND
ncbi:MAG: isopeptide-forming domain-containing fimbrial protein [Ruminococcus sp.]|nr:isopeptide-forming domain-containing fimbrial protein [Ruminococcus sp.]